MATRNFVPRQNKDGCIGTEDNSWAIINAYNVNAKEQLSTPYISTNTIKSSNITVSTLLTANFLKVNNSVETALLKLTDSKGNSTTLNASQLSNLLNNQSTGTSSGSGNTTNVDLSQYVTKLECANPSASIIPVSTNSINLGSNEVYWNKAYISSLYNSAIHTSSVDASTITAKTITLTDSSGRALQLTTDTVLNSSGGNIDDNGNVISDTYTTKIEDKNPTTSIVPMNNNTVNLGSANRYWNNAYITNINNNNITTKAITTNGLSLIDVEGNKVDITAADLLNQGSTVEGDTSLLATKKEDKNPSTSIVPAVNNAINLGSASRYWNNIYVTNNYSATINSNDINSQTITANEVVLTDNAGNTLPLTANTKILTLTDIYNFINENFTFSTPSEGGDTPISSSSSASIVPTTNNLELGSSVAPWKTVYANEMVCDNLKTSSGQTILKLAEDENGDYSFL